MKLMSMSDKALLEMARHGDQDACRQLAKRFGVELPDVGATVAALRGLRYLSVSAAKRIIFANA